LFDIATEEKLFDSFVTPGVIAEIKSASKLWSEVDMSDDLTIGGYAAKQKVLVEASQATSASNTDQYPAPQESTPAETLVYLKRSQMFSLKFSGFALVTAAKRGTGGAAMEPIEFEKTGIFITMRDDMSRQLMWDGSGRLAQANGLGSGTATLVLDSPYNIKEPTKFLAKNLYIDGYDPGDDSHDIDGIKISSVDSATQVTLASTQTWADNTWIHKKNTWRKTEAPGQGEMMGLLGICSDADPPTGALQGLDVSGYPMWKANVFSNGGVARPLSEDLLILAIQKTKKFGDISKMFALITEKIERVWLAYLRSFKTMDTRVQWGGWVGVPFYYGGKQIPMIPDEFVPDGHILGGDKSKLTLYVTSIGKEVEWEKGLYSGGILQNVQGYHQYAAYGHIFSNLGVSVRKAFFKISDIQEPDV